MWIRGGSFFIPMIECAAKGAVFTVVGTLAVTFAILAGVFKKK